MGSAVVYVIRGVMKPHRGLANREMNLISVGGSDAIRTMKPVMIHADPRDEWRGLARREQFTPGLLMPLVVFEVARRPRRRAVGEPMEGSLDSLGDEVGGEDAG